MTRYPSPRIYCRVPLPEPAPRKPLKLTAFGAVTLGLSLGAAIGAAVFAIT